MLLLLLLLLLFLLLQQDNAYYTSVCRRSYHGSRLLLSSLPSIPSIESIAATHDNINNTDTSSKLRLLMDTISLTKLQLEKESSRKYRRTVFTSIDWVRHRSPTRYLNALTNTPRSNILRGLTSQALGVTIVSFLICLYNIMIEKFLQNVPFFRWKRFVPILSLGLFPWTLTSPSLGLLLVFRTNAAYSRWSESRTSWAVVQSKTFDVMRQGMNWMSDKRLKAELVRYLAVFAKTLKWWLGNRSNQRRLKNDLIEIMTTEELEDILKSNHPVQYSLMKISQIIGRADLFPNIQTHIDRYICELSNALYVCDRIFTTPIPLLYTRHTARFLLLWLLTLPFALYHELKSPWRLIQIPVISFFTSIFLFGIEDLGVQIEEPFSILPLGEICLGIQSTGKSMLETQNIDWFEGINMNTGSQSQASNSTDGVTNEGSSIFTTITDSITELISIEIRNNTLLSVPQDSVATEIIETKQ